MKHTHNNLPFLLCFDCTFGNKKVAKTKTLRLRHWDIKAAKRMESRAVRNSPKSHNSNQPAVEKEKSKEG